MNSQKRKTKLCECGRGKIYTDGLSKQPEIDGKIVCSECKLDEIIKGFMSANKKEK
jgi:hypothetical protein